MSQTNIYRFPVYVGDNVNNNDLVGIGGEVGWVTRLSCPENQHAVMEGLHFFKSKIPKNLVYLGYMIKNKDINAYFEELHLDDNPITPGLYVTIRIRSKTNEECESMKDAIVKNTRFFISGEMEVSWVKSDIKGTVDSPYITGFSISKFGYFSLGSRIPRIVFNVL